MQILKSTEGFNLLKFTFTTLTFYFQMSTKNFFYFHRFTFTSTTLPVFNSKSTTFISVSLAFIFNFQYFIRFSFIVNLNLLFLSLLHFLTTDFFQLPLLYQFLLFCQLYFGDKKTRRIFQFLRVRKISKISFP